MLAQPQPSVPALDRTITDARRGTGKALLIGGAILTAAIFAMAALQSLAPDTVKAWTGTASSGFEMMIVFP